MKKKRGKYGKLFQCIKCGRKGKGKTMVTNGFDYPYCVNTDECHKRIDANLARYIKQLKKRGKNERT